MFNPHSHGEGAVVMHGKLEIDDVAARKRGEKRRKLFLAATAGQSAGTCSAEILNLSTSGMLLRTTGALDLDEPLTVVLPDAGERLAIIVWEADKLYGCRFERTLSQGEVSAMVLRSAPRKLADKEPGARVDETFGERLKRLRSASRFSMIELAACVGVTKPTLWKWETGKVRPRERAIEDLARVLEIDPVELLYGPDQRKTMPAAVSAPVPSGQSGKAAKLADIIARSRVAIADCAGTDLDRVSVEINWN